MRYLIFTVCFIFIGVNSFASILNVPSTYTTIQAALNAATVGDTVLVQPGTYMENLIWPNTADLKLLSAGDTTNTIIDGGGTGICLAILVPINNTTIISGFRFTNGSTVNYSGGTGAGIKIDNGASPTIDSCMVDNNTGNGSRCYGAGVSIDGGTARIRNSSIINNHAVSNTGNYDYGGGMYIIGGANVSIINSNISGNDIPTSSRAYGGGIHISAARVDLTNCKVNTNDIRGTNYCYGGGIYLTSLATLNMIGGEIDGNKLSNTSRTYGGGIHLTGSQANLNQVKITNQDMTTTSFSKGNGIFLTTNSSLTMENCLVAKNMINGAGSGYSGGGIFSESSYLSLNHCTVVDNDRVGGANLTGVGIFFDGVADTLDITSSIIYNPNPATDIYFNGGLLNVNYSNVRGGQPGTGNINSLPLFIGAPNYQLQGISPCLELADPASTVLVDIDGNVRPSIGTTVADMGCYESSSIANPPMIAVTPDTSICSGDSVMLVVTVFSGGTPPFTYAWTPAATLNNGSIVNPMASPTTTTIYQVIVTDSVGLKDTAMVTVTVNTCTGINENKLSYLSVYPNPVSESVTIKGLDKFKQVDKFEIISITGKVVYISIEIKENINLSNLKEGIYFLRILHEQGVKTVKFIKN